MRAQSSYQDRGRRFAGHKLDPDAQIFGRKKKLHRRRRILFDVCVLRASWARKKVDKGEESSSNRVSMVGATLGFQITKLRM